MEKSELIKSLTYIESKLIDLKKVLNIESILETNKQLEEAINDTSFWQDQANAKKTIDELNYNKDILTNYYSLENSYNDLSILLELDDKELFDSVDDEVNSLILKIDEAYNMSLLNDKFDRSNCYLEIHPGAGGTESQDWVSMLLRMYKRFSEAHNLKFSVIDYQEANDAGIKSVTVYVEGINSYGLLQSENGVHRLVRISPFDSNARRHTSFAGVKVIPEIENVEIEINPNDLRIDTYRSSGAGGQYVNTTDSAVRITHIPTGIVVSSQNERSQIQNRAQCMKLLKAKLFDLAEKKKKEDISSYASTLDNAFGSQIRSYVLQPYTIVKDHRTNYEVGNALKVLDGDIDGFINAYLKYKALGGKNEEN